jgi:hypothetical protein
MEHLLQYNKPLTHSEATNENQDDPDRVAVAPDGNHRIRRGRIAGGGGRHEYPLIERERGYGLDRTPLVFLVGREGFEPATS